VQSLIHPGDGRWRFLSVIADVGNASWIAVHLLLLSAGTTEFARPMLMALAD